MDRRLALALLLSGLAVVVSSMLFPPAPRRPPPSRTVTDSTPVTAAVPLAPTLEPTRAPTLVGGPVDTLTLRTERAEYEFSTLGGVPVGIRLGEYRALNRDSGVVQLVRDSVPLVAFQLVVGRDTIKLSEVPFSIRAHDTVGRQAVTFHALTPAGEVMLAYDLEPEGYVIRLNGEVPPAASELITTLPRGLRSEEADVEDDRRYL